MIDNTFKIYDRISKKYSKSETLRFLNFKAREFYDCNCYFFDSHYESNLKADILSLIIDIERTIRGCFDCSLEMENVNDELFTELFPYATNVLFGNKKSFDKQKISYLLQKFRNINAHSFLSEDDFKLFDLDFSFLCSAKKMNEDLVYFDDGLTISGMLFIIFNFVREQSIEIFLKKHPELTLMIGENIFIPKRFDKKEIAGVKFVKQISNVNLETSIRESQSKTIIESIFGNYLNMCNVDKDNYKIAIGKANYPTFLLNCLIKDSKLIVKKGSLTKSFYNEDYELHIEDISKFIELSNMLPPFAFVDYLHEKKVYKFNAKEYDDTCKDLFHFKKINQAKFYVNKNISVILMKNTISDFSIMSNLVTEALNLIFLSLESYIYRKFRKGNGCNESTLSKALGELDMPNDLENNIRYVRNFAAHGYILDEYNVQGERALHFDMEYIIKTLSDFLNFLKENDSIIFSKATFCIENIFINRIIRALYFPMWNITSEFMKTYPNYDKETLSKRLGFVKNASFDIRKLNEMQSIIGMRTKVIRLKNNFELYSRGDIFSENLIDDFIKKNNLTITKIKDEKIIKTYYLTELK